MGLRRCMHRMMSTAKRADPYVDMAAYIQVCFCLQNLLSINFFLPDYHVQ